ncbi:MAG: hypothetical protein ACR2QK_02600 [Acidimicrobiales bacterium]
MPNEPTGSRAALEITSNSISGLSIDPTSSDLLALSLGAETTTTIGDGEAAESTDGSGSGETSTSSSGPGVSTSAGGGATTVVGSASTGGPTTTARPTTTRPATTAAPPPPPVDTGSVPGNGQVFYVSSGSGNDANDGLSTSKPWKSLETGIQRLKPGQTLRLMSGEYRELKSAGVAHYSIDRGGTAGNWIKITSAPGHNPVIVASNGSGIIIQAPYVEFSGITVRGSGFNAGNNWGVGVAVSETHHVRVVGNSISRMATSGISVTNSSNFQVIGNDVYENAFWSPLQGSGISVWHSRNKGFGADSDGYHDRIIGNRVHSNENIAKSQFKDFKLITDGNGIIVDSNQETGYSGRTLVANNLVYDNGGRGIISWQSDRVDIMFNTGYQNGQTDGISGGATEFAAGKGNDIVMANNVGWARSGLPALIFDRVSNGRSFNNVLVTDSPSGHASSRDIMHSGNPGFRNPSVSAGSADFRPTAGSVLDDKAQETPWFITADLVGTSRGSGTPDIGAFEAEAARR